TCGSTLAAGSTCTMVVAFQPPAVASYSTTATLDYTDGAGAHVASRPLTGTGTDVAELVIYDYDIGINFGPEFDFGTWGVGITGEHTFWIYNQGARDATAVASTSPSGPFSWKGGSYPGTGGTCATAIAAGTRCSVVAAFTPTAAGAATATFTVGYQDGVGAQSATRPVRGTGTTDALVEIAERLDFPLPAGDDLGVVAVGSST